MSSESKCPQCGGPIPPRLRRACVPGASWRSFHPHRAGRGACHQKTLPPRWRNCRPPSPTRNPAAHWPGWHGLCFQGRQPKLDRFVALKSSPNPSRRSGLRRTIQPRRPLAGPPQPSEYRHHSRFRPSRRFLLSPHGICGWRQPPPGDESGPFHSLAGAGDCAENLRGAPIRAQRRRPPPRHQAGEYSAGLQGPREDRRLRHRENHRTEAGGAACRSALKSGPRGSTA